MIKQQMSEKTDDMTSTLDDALVTSSLDDSFAYIPLEDVPDGLLDKLSDFKVIVKDKEGDRILPKERLGEVLESMDRVGSPVSRQTEGRNTSRMNHANSLDVCVNEYKAVTLNNLPSIYPTSASSPKRQASAVPHVSNQTTPLKCDFQYSDKIRAHNVLPSFPCQGYQRMPGISRHLKGNPQYTTVPRSPDMDSDSYSYEPNNSYCPKRPVKELHRRLCRPVIGNVACARKRLSFSTDSAKDCDSDSPREQYYRYADKSPHGDEREISVCLRDHSYPNSPQCGLKRKYSSSENEAESSHSNTQKYPRAATGRAEELLLQTPHAYIDLHRDHIGVDQYHQTTSVPHCACSSVKQNLLRMTKSAYQNIHRRNCTHESFEKFRNELKEMNSVLQESVDVLRAVEKLCCHKI